MAKQVNIKPTRQNSSPNNFKAETILQERLLGIDHIQARRFSNLTGAALLIATEGIIRHLRACDRLKVAPDSSALREIIDDALNGRRLYAEQAV